MLRRSTFNAPVAENLSDFPESLRDDARYPWETPVVEAGDLIWQWGLDAGKPLKEIASRELVRKQKWLLQKQGAGSYFQKLVDGIETVLQSRDGL